MRTTRWLVLSLLASAALALGCADASDEELPDQTSDDAPTVDVAKPDPCAPTETDGDVVDSVSGYDMSTPEAALEAYARLREASSCTATVTRRGKELNIQYEIR
jgi:hypothetical protein